MDLLKQFPWKGMTVIADHHASGGLMFFTTPWYVYRLNCRVFEWDYVFFSSVKMHPVIHIP
jgi:hypothetical protein